MSISIHKRLRKTDQEDYKEAAKRYRMTAMSGSVAAQYILGRMYYEGTKVDKDPIMAYVFLL